MHGPASSPTGEEAEPNEKGLQFYSDLFAEMHKNGIEPLVTLSHYEMPLALATKYNGWVDRRVIDCFAKFCHACFERYKDQVKYWLTFNEVDSVIRHPFTTAGIIPSRVPEDKMLETCYQALHPPAGGQRYGSKGLPRDHPPAARWAAC